MDCNKTESSDAKTEEELVKDGRNALLVFCQRCQSKIIRPGKALYVSREHFIPFMRKKSESSDVSDGELIENFWQVDDKFTFENIGFSNTVGSMKYLTCADCEIGPIGIHDLQTDISYVATNRVEYK